MKAFQLLLLFSLLALRCFSQDSLQIQNELKEIKIRRAIINEKIVLLEESIAENQLMIDSVHNKIVQLKQELDLMKPGSTEKEIVDHEKRLKEMLNMVDEINQKQVKKQLVADQAKQLVSALDQQINELTLQQSVKKEKGMAKHQ